MTYIQRGLETTLAAAAAAFPAVMLSGPRQTGKTTLLREQFGRNYRYVSLEQPPIRALARQDPGGFLDLYRAPVILDEIQYAPELLPYIKERIDADRGRMGQYLLTGSQNLLLMETVSETLAGRTAVLRLYPLARRELDGEHARPLPWEPVHELREMDPDAFVRRQVFCEQLLIGGYPDVVRGPASNRTLWFASYVQTYVERDVRQLRQIGDLGQFQLLVKAVALRSGQLFNLSEVARDLGLAINTVKAWLSVLEASGLVVILRPYFENAGKRLVKTPKVYFTDTGLLCHLVGITTAEQLALSSFGGAVMETAVLMELVKALSFRGPPPGLYFWRTSNRTEVDFVLDNGNRRLTLIEAKATRTPMPGDAAPLERLAAGIKNYRCERLLVA
ncbi:MAG: ATP-binding protein, partial [bacterium]